MFQIPVSDLLASYSGDSKSFSFSGEVYEGYFSDISFLKPLEFSVRIIALDDGVDVIFDSLSTTVKYEGKKYTIAVGHFERTYKTHLDPLDPDDIRPIENNMIDLAPVLREEIIMATYGT
jgi:hypothetical protein